MKRRNGSQGTVLVVAIVAAIVVSLTAVVVLNLTFRRFHLSHMGSDHEAALFASEAGIRYALQRLDVNDTNQLIDKNGKPSGDPNIFFRDRVKGKALQEPPQELVVSSDPKAPSLDHWEPNLQMGGKHVTIGILYNPAGAPSDRPYKVRASSDYGT